MKVTHCLMALAASLLTASLANAAPILGDFREELSLPYCCGAGVRVFERLAEPIAGAPDLSDEDEIANPRDYSGHADVDLSAGGLITLTGREPLGFANYELAIFRISNLVFDAGESIIGVLILDGTGVFDSDRPLSPAPLVSFTSNSVVITYDTGGQDQFNFGEGETSTFQLQTSQTPTAVPEPATLSLLGMGIAGAVARRRALRRK